MTKRIGVIGNSHLSAFKLGWETAQTRFPEFELTFFGSTASSLRHLRVHDGCLIPTAEIVRDNLIWTSGGYDHIPGNHDAYIVVGMGFSFIHLMALLKNHRTPHNYDPDQGHQLISKRFFEGAMNETLTNSNAVRVLTMLKQITQSPIVYTPNPFGTKEILTDKRYDFLAHESVRKYVFDYYQEAKNRILKTELCILKEQPVETIDAYMFTKSEYSRGSIKLKKGMRSPHNDNDYFHMNAHFGEISLEQILSSTMLR